MSEEDITKHEFFDSRITHDGDTLNVEHDEGYNLTVMHLDLNKKDAIALANHFNLTVDDLKTQTQ